MKRLVILIGGITLLTSCNLSTNPEPISTSSGQAVEMKASTPLTNEKKAVVLETLDAGTYTYLLLEADGEEFWAAVTARPVEIGKSYYYTESVWMRDFESKQLQRTFDSVLFIDFFGEQPPHAGNVAATSSTQDHTSTSRKESMTITHGSDEITLENLFGNKEKYNGKQVQVRGEVVKISMNIMDRNWIHIQDGTSHEGQYDLTVTLNNVIGFELNDIVSFEGTITIDKDFGSGYFYPVIMENAKQVVKAE